MSQYGIEMYSDSGYKFLITDNYSFVFSHYVDLSIQGSTNGGPHHIYTTPAPQGSNALVFVRMTSGAIVLVSHEYSGNNLNLYARYTHTTGLSTLRAYIFYDREPRPVSSSYGIQVFDENGATVYHTDSKPLRLQRANWGFVDGWSVDVGYPVAVAQNFLGVRYSSAGAYSIFWNVIGTASGNTLSAGVMLRQMIPEPGYQFHVDVESEILYINTSFYD